MAAQKLKRHIILLLRLALEISIACRSSCAVTIRNWTACTTITVPPTPDGAAEELDPTEWMQFKCTGKGSFGMFALGNRKGDNVVTILLKDGQSVALVDNVSHSIDEILVDEKGPTMESLFINL